MSLPDYISRLKKARIVQVLAVYVGASWVVLQVADALTDALELPAWVSPVVVLLLLVGLVVVLATAWVQAHPLVESRAATDEVPRAWELDVGDLGRSVKGGRLPHLNWARALLGGLVAFSLLFGIAGAWVLFRQPDRPLAAADADAAPGVAVLPFDARGVDEELWGEGLVDLISTNLDGVAGLRAIDSRTVLARWRRRGGGLAELSESLDVAREVGARFAVVGSALGVGNEVRVSARLYEADGREVGAGQVQGAPDSVLTLIDQLSVELVRELIEERDMGVPARSLARVTTSSVPALRAFLRGEAASRRADFQTAIRAYEEALAADSTFALAASRLSTAYGWMQARGSDASTRYGALAARHADRLPERDRELLTASDAALHDGDPAALQDLRRLANRYPDDPEIWMALGEALNHLGPMVLATREEETAAFNRAIALDSALAPAYIHPTEAVLGAARDSAAARKWIEAYDRVSADTIRRRSFEYGFRLLYDPDPAPPEGPNAELVLSVTGGTLDRGGFRTFRALRPLLEHVAALDAVPPNAPSNFVDVRRFLINAGMGRVDAALAVWNDMPPEVAGEAGRILVTEYGLALPDSLLAPMMTVDSAQQGRHLLNVTLLAAATGRGATVRDGLELMRRRVDRSPDSVALAGIALVQGYAAMVDGDEQTALARLEEAYRRTVGYRAENMNETARTWIGRLHLQAGRHDEAIRYFRSIRGFPIAGLLLAESYEAVGRTDSARVWYADMARLWEGADEDFEPLLRARRGLERLRGRG